MAIVSRSHAKFLGPDQFRLRGGIFHRYNLRLRNASSAPSSVTSRSGFQSPMSNVFETTRVPGFRSSNSFARRFQHGWHGFCGGGPAGAGGLPEGRAVLRQGIGTGQNRRRENAGIGPSSESHGHLGNSVSPDEGAVNRGSAIKYAAGNLPGT